MYDNALCDHVSFSGYAREWSLNCDSVVRERDDVAPPSHHQSYPASAVLCSDPTPFRPFAFLVSSTCTAYSVRV